MASVPFNNLITFSRGSNATVTGSNGLIQWAPNNALTNSESFDAASWTKSDTTVTANAATAPDGTTTADKLIEAANTAEHTVNQTSFSYAATTTYSLSVYAKAAERSILYMRLGNSPFGAATQAFFNLNTGTVGTQTNCVGSIVDVGGGWYRCSAVATTTTTGIGPIKLGPTTTDNVISYAGNGTSGIYIWGAQLELGSAATTYNSTTVKNLLGYSEAFDNAAWTKSSTSIVTGAQANPVNGAFNAQKLMEDTVATVPHGFASANVTTIVGTPMTSAFYAKAAGRSWVVANAFNAANKRCWFDLVNGTTGTTAAGCTTSITSVGNGWYRCAVIQTAAATTMSLGLYASTADGVLSYTGDGNSGVYIYGAQLSDSASLDPYVPTPAAAPSSTAYYGPRFDYDPVTLAPKGLLVEEARTNLATYSNDFADASWVALGAKNLVANSTVSPDGATNASTLTDNSAVAFQGVNKTFTVANDNASYTASIYVRKTTGGTSATFGFNLQITGGTLVAASPRINTDTGAVLSGTATVQNAGAYWRITSTVTNNTTGNTALALSVYPATAPHGVAPDSSAATGSAIIYGAQVEAGAFATSYIPTVASTVTRSADVATINGSLFSQWYAQSAGTFVAEGSTFSNGSTGLVTASSPSTLDYMHIRRGAGAPSFRIQTAAGVQADFGTIASTGKTAAAYLVNDFAVSSNGGAVSTDTSGAVPTVTSFELGALYTAFFLNGHIRSIDYIPARAADFQLQALTT